MFGVVLVGTFWRYVLNDPILWTEEAARYLMIWMALIAASISMKRREHVSMNLLINPLPAVIKRIVGTLTSLAVAFFLLVLTREGITMVFRHEVRFHLPWVYRCFGLCFQSHYLGY